MSEVALFLQLSILGILGTSIGYFLKPVVSIFFAVLAALPCLYVYNTVPFESFGAVIVVLVAGHAAVFIIAIMLGHIIKRLRRVPGGVLNAIKSRTVDTSR